jgi:hypothetical protein
MNEQSAVSPSLLFAIQPTVVVPIGKLEPDGGEQAIIAPPGLFKAGGG